MSVNDKPKHILEVENERLRADCEGMDKIIDHRNQHIASLIEREQKIRQLIDWHTYKRNYTEFVVALIEILDSP